MAVDHYFGKKYIFEVESKRVGKGMVFRITAINRASGRCSQINNLTRILSAFGIEDDDPLMEDSDWLLSAKKLECFQGIGAEIFQDQSTLQKIEADLEEDRMVSEWANTHRLWQIGNWVNRVRKTKINEWLK